jgi:hypothetical protein
MRCNFLVLLCARKWREEEGIPGTIMRKRNGARWNGWCCDALEGGGRKGDSWCCHAKEEWSEMECLVLRCARREAEGGKGDSWCFVRLRKEVR